MIERKKQDNLTKAYNAGISLLAARTRSVKEVRDALYKKKFPGDIISQVILKLKKSRLLDDNKFAAEFVLTRERLRPKSKFALKYELRQKGVSDSIIEKAISDIDEYESAHRAVNLKISAWSELDRDKIKHKMITFLKNRGFNFEISSAIYEKIYGDISI